jgi:hypothetical protein
MIGAVTGKIRRRLAAPADTEMTAHRTKVSRDSSCLAPLPGKASCQSKIRTIRSPINFPRMNLPAMSRSPH